jgi:hypothetical protein
MNLDATFGEKQHLRGRRPDNILIVHDEGLSLHSSIIDPGAFPSTPVSTLVAGSTNAAYAA